ncbi:WD40 repeat domain-containing serine/threonine protein kinase [Streptomyces collinus]|uniref:WD40 repeat domain-containing serine/threonine protein kinase n=1 Tax=Streptomyces collinus TaxID=42684 RepID=UPI0036426FFC
MRPLRAPEDAPVAGFRPYAHLGGGGLGRVLLAGARDGRTVALKLVHGHFLDDTGFRARLRRETDAARRVSGTYVAALTDADPEAPVPWLASEFVHGVPLREVVDVLGGLPEEPVLRLAACLAAALADVHRAGLVHRGLSPGNVLLTSDGLKVTDFGLARATDREGGGHLTPAGWLAGAPGFMSPELAEGHRATPRGDVFSLGAVLAAASLGRQPFAGPSTPQTLYNVVHTEPDLDAVPDRLRAVVESCLAKDPLRRPTPDELLAELGTPVPSPRPWPPAVHILVDRRRADVRRLMETASGVGPGEAGRGADEGGPGGVAATGSVTDVAGRDPGADTAHGDAEAGQGHGAETGGGAPEPEPGPRQKVPAGAGQGRAGGWRAAGVGAVTGLSVLLAGHLAWGLLADHHRTDAAASTARHSASSAGQSRREAPGSAASTTRPAARPPVTLFGHTGPVTSVAFSPDGRTLVTAGFDGTVRLWDVARRRANGRPLVKGPLSYTSVAFSPDGRTVAAGSADGTARLWSTARHRGIGAPFRIGSGAIHGVAFGPDGRTLATGGDHGDLRLWEVPRGRQLGETFPRYPDWAINAVAFSPDGRVLATGGDDGRLRLWDVASHRQLGLPVGNFLLVDALAFSPDGRTVAAASWDHVTRLWDVAGHRLVAELKDAEIVSGVAFSPDGRTLATADNVELRLWDARRHRPLGRIRSGAVATPGCVAFSPDGRWVATGSADDDGAVQLWDVNAFR